MTTTTLLSIGIRFLSEDIHLLSVGVGLLSEDIHLLSVVVGLLSVGISLLSVAFPYLKIPGPFHLSGCNSLSPQSEILVLVTIICKRPKKVWTSR